MKSSLFRATLACLALAPFASAALEEHLPAGTFGLVKIEHIEKSRERLAAHPLRKGPGADRLAAFFAPLLEQARAKDGKAFADFEQARDAALKHFKGEFVWGVVQTPAPLPGHLPFDLVTLADTDADEATLADFLKDTKLFQPTPEETEEKTAPAHAAGTGATPQSEDTDDEDESPTPTAAGANPPKPTTPKREALVEDFAGVKLHLLATRVDDKSVSLGGWALVDKTFLYASAPNVLKELVESRKAGRKDAFTDSTLYKSNKDALADRDAWILFNLPLIASAGREQLVAMLAERKQAGRPAPGGGMFDALKTYDAMAFDNLEHARMTVSLKSNDTRIDSSLAWKERKGLVNLIQYKADAAPESFLAPADAVSVDASRVDISATLATFESMLREAFPFASPMLDLQLDKLKNEQGLDIRSAILANFGDSLACITGEAPEGADAVDAMPQVWAITLKDETKLASFIETILGKLSATQTGDGKKAVFDEREILGVKVRDIKTGTPGAPRIAYALHKNRLLVSKGAPALLDKVIGQLVAPKPGLDASPDHRAGLDRLPAGGCGVSHADLGRLVNLVCTAIAKIKDMKGADGAPGVDETKIPRPSDFPFVVVGKAYASPTGLDSHAVLVPKSGDDAK